MLRIIIIITNWMNGDRSWCVNNGMAEQLATDSSFNVDRSLRIRHQTQYQRHIFNYQIDKTAYLTHICRHLRTTFQYCLESRSLSTVSTIDSRPRLLSIITETVITSRLVFSDNEGNRLIINASKEQFY